MRTARRIWRRARSRRRGSACGRSGRPAAPRPAGSSRSRGSRRSPPAGGRFSSSTPSARADVGQRRDHRVDGEGVERHQQRRAARSSRARRARRSPSLMGGFEHGPRAAGRSPAQHATVQSDGSRGLAMIRLAMAAACFPETRGCDGRMSLLLGANRRRPPPRLCRRSRCRRRSASRAARADRARRRR